MSHTVPARQLFLLTPAQLPPTPVSETGAYAQRVTQGNKRQKQPENVLTGRRRDGTRTDTIEVNVSSVENQFVIRPEKYFDSRCICPK